MTEWIKDIHNIILICLLIVLINFRNILFKKRKSNINTYIFNYQVICDFNRVCRTSLLPLITLSPRYDGDPQGQILRPKTNIFTNTNIHPQRESNP